jgi:hypothetical protein
LSHYCSIIKITSKFRALRLEGKTPDLITAALFSQAQLAIELRDKAYGFLWLLDKATQAEVTVDISKPLIAEPTKSLLARSQGDTEVLSSAGQSNCKISGLTSWCIDFSSTPLCIVPGDDYHASRSQFHLAREQNVTIQKRGAVIKFTGWKVDQVAEV